MKLTRFMLVLTLAAILAGSALAQTPAVGGLLNNYSFTLPGLPNYGIAQGSIFDIFGTNLSGGTTIPLQNPPLQTTLGGISVSVTVNGTTTQPLLYFVSDTQIDAILPSSTPVGTGTLTVTNAAGTSAPFAIKVVESAFGLLTFNNGSGPVAGYNASNNSAMMTYTAAANPGDILELWGTGLGPVPDDGTGVEVSSPIEVDIGGVSATVSYHGRSSFAGLDQINVQVPQGVSGCNLSVVVVTGDYVSNFGTLAVAPSGSRTCSDPGTGLTSDILDTIANTGTFTGGFISLNKTTTAPLTVGPITIPGTTTDSGSASFSRVTSAQFAAGYGLTSIGSCSVLTFSGQTPPPTVTATSLNAGAAINITGPQGSLAMALQTFGGISFYSTPANSSFIPATGGAFHFDNGSGGTDVGPFTADLAMPAPLQWTNMNDITTVTRSAGVTVNWTGGDPTTYATITGMSLDAISDTDAVGGFFTCLAPVAAGTFTVPPSVLLTLPPSTSIAGVSVSTLTVGNSTKTAYFTAPNVDVAGVSATVSNSTNVSYQ